MSNHHNNIVSKFEKTVELLFVNGFTSPRVAVRNDIEISFCDDDDHRTTTCFPMDYFDLLDYKEVFHELMQSYQWEMANAEGDY